MQLNPQNSISERYRLVPICIGKQAGIRLFESFDDLWISPSNEEMAGT